jgi:hypothetical protein
MQKELDEVSRFFSSFFLIFIFQIKQAMIWNAREQKESVERFERKSSEEKMRLQQESNKKIAEIAEHAQDDAIK